MLRPGNPFQYPLYSKHGTTTDSQFWSHRNGVKNCWIKLDQINLGPLIWRWCTSRSVSFQPVKPTRRRFSLGAAGGYSIARRRREWPSPRTHWVVMMVDDSAGNGSRVWPWSQHRWAEPTLSARESNSLRMPHAFGRLLPRAPCLEFLRRIFFLVLAIWGLGQLHAVTCVTDLPTQPAAFYMTALSVKVCLDPNANVQKY